MCIAGGFAVIGTAFALIVSSGHATTNTQQIIVAALGPPVASSPTSSRLSFCAFTQAL